MKLTLKITKTEYNLISAYVHSDKCFMGITLPLDDEFGCFVNVHNIDRFRKSLNDSIENIRKNGLDKTIMGLSLYFDVANNLESILLKLDKENKECEKCDGKGYPYQDDNIDCDECYGTGREAK